MARLLWDQVGERFYETGLDRGVLYLGDGRGVPWNGLLSVQEDFGDDSSTPRYYDGIKHRDVLSVGDYSATLTAITYPDEFLEFEGVLSLADGFYVDDQTPKPFSLSYRTRVGNDVDGAGHGYRIHVLYNLIVSSDDIGYESLSGSPEITEFGWTIRSIPERLPGYKPTAHIIFDSRALNPSLLEAVEEALYGSENSDPNLLTLNEFFGLAYYWDPRRIVSEPFTGLTYLVRETGDLTPSYIPGLYQSIPRTRLKPSGVIGFYFLDEDVVERIPTANYSGTYLFTGDRLGRRVPKSSLVGWYNFTGHINIEYNFDSQVDAGYVGEAYTSAHDAEAPLSDYSLTLDGGDPDSYNAVVGLLDGGEVSEPYTGQYSSGGPFGSHTSTADAGGPSSFPSVYTAIDGGSSTNQIDNAYDGGSSTNTTTDSIDGGTA